MKSIQLFEVRRIVRTVSGRRLSIFMDLWEVKKPQRGLFLDWYRLSWIAFDLDEPDQKILIDAHPPKGIHMHVNEQNAQELVLQTLENALEFFRERVEEKFGKLEEPLL